MTVLARALSGIREATPPAEDPYPAHNRLLFRTYCLLLGLAGGAALAGAAVAGGPGYTITPQLVWATLPFVLMAVGTSYFSFRVGSGTSYSISDIAPFSALLVLGPGPAALVAVLAQLWEEPFIQRRDGFFALRTAGMYALMYLISGAVYLPYAQAVGLSFPLPVTGPQDLIGPLPAAAVGLTLIYIVARLVNDLLLMISRRFYGESPRSYLRNTFSISSLIDGATLPVALLTALLYSSLSVMGFVLWVALVILMANLMKRLSDARTQLQERVVELVRTSAQLRAEQAAKVRLEQDLSTTSANLRRVAEAQAGALAEQASAVTQVSATITELSQSAGRIALAADQVAQAATQALDLAGGGQAAIGANLQSMTRIAEQVAAITTRMEELHARAGRVGQIVGLIGEIADETHLLALNARIEAAGAGDHGGRFAVVAAEVNSLSARAVRAAQDVQDILAEIQQANAAALTATRTGAAQVRHGVDLSRQSGEAHAAISEMVQQASDLAHAISLATQQQRSASEQVALIIRQVADNLRASAANSQEVSATAVALNRLAEELGGATDTP